MLKGIVKIENKDSWVGSWDLSKGLEMRHRLLAELIESKRTSFEKYGQLKKYGLTVDDGVFDIVNQNTRDKNCVVSPVKKIKKRSGGQVQQFLINEHQYIFLLTILPNTEKSIKFKEKLTDEFIRMRKILIQLSVQKQNAEWIEKREAGKIERKYSTDSIKDFEIIAKDNGSKHHGKYYMQITKMLHEALFAKEIIEYGSKDLRDKLSLSDLELVKIGDMIIKQSIADGTKEKAHYKDIYKSFIRDRTEGFAFSIGRTPLRFLKKEITCQNK